MTRRRTAVGCFLVALMIGLPAFAQEGEEGQPDGDATEGEQAPTTDADPQPEGEPPPSDDALKTTPPVDTAPPTVAASAKGDAQQSWKDIVVLPRKPFLKGGRFEISPYFGVTMNDNLIQHYSIGGEVNYYLTDILSIGVSGLYYFKNVLDEEFHTRYHFGRVPSLNRYRFTTTLNFSYVPFYGKFAMFNKHIMHWEVYLGAGVGVSGTEIIPRDYQNETFSNLPVWSFRLPAVGGRLFINRWLAAHAMFVGMAMVDKYEPSPRVLGSTGEEAKEAADPAFVYNMMFNIGVSFFLPTSFNYTTFR